MVVAIYYELVKLILPTWPAPSPDDRFHHCSYYPMANDNALVVVLASSLADQRTPRTKALIGWLVLQWRRAQPMR
jgi:hypothetical protein